MPEKINLYATVSTFQNFDGTNFTTAGVEAKTSLGPIGLGAYVGLGSDFKDKATGVFDVKCNGKYTQDGTLGFNGRVRTKLGKNEQSTEVRVSPLSVNIPISKSVSAYFTPCARAKYNYFNNSWTPSATVFAVITWKPDDKTSISAEVQSYDTQNAFNGSGEFLNGENWSGNLVISHKIY